MKEGRKEGGGRVLCARVLQKNVIGPGGVESAGVSKIGRQREHHSHASVSRKEMGRGGGLNERRKTGTSGRSTHVENEKTVKSVGVDKLACSGATKRHTVSERVEVGSGVVMLQLEKGEREKKKERERKGCRHRRKRRGKRQKKTW